jgi:hypothetical protein
MPINFPNTPANNDIHTESGVSWKYNTTVSAWLVVQSTTGGGGGASVSVGNTAPVSPTNGDLWWNSDIGTLFVYYNDGSSSQWVENIPGSGNEGLLGPATLTGNSANSRLELTQTWNTTGTPTAFRVNVTDTASDGSSVIFSADKNGTPVFYVDKFGTVFNQDARFTGGQWLYLGASSKVLWGGQSGTALQADATGVLALRNDANAQAFRLYETWTDSSNGAWLGFRAANTRYEISGQSNGTGTTREVAMPLGLELDARTAPAAPANNRSRIYAESAGGGLTKIMARFPSGSAQQIAIEGGVATIPIAAPKLDPAYYYFPPFTDNHGGSSTATAGRMWVFPYFFQRPTTFNRIGFRTHNTHTASVNVRLGLFNDRTSQTSNGPGTLIYDSGDMATVGADTDHVATINQTLVGTVWIAFMASGSTASFQIAGYFRPEFNLLFGLSDNQGYGLSGTAPFRDRTYGAYGDESGNTFSQSNLGSPGPFLRAV